MQAKAITQQTMSSRAATSLACVFSFFLTSSAFAHEFWINPSAEYLQPGETISADLRVGQNMSGGSYPYVSKTISGMKHWAPNADITLKAREGDRPAISNISLKQPGLHKLTVQTNPAYIVFEDIAEFEEYLQFEGLADIAVQHRARGLSETDIAEAYIRNAKALLQVGLADASQSDRPGDLPFELTARGNPYVAGVRSLDVHLTWRGHSVADSQVSVFHLPLGGTAPGDTQRSVLRTNAAGLVSVDLKGPGEYLLNAVRMMPVQGPGSVVWESYWASLTFRIAD